MLRLTRKADYGLRLMLEVSAQSEGSLTVAEAAERQQMPHEFLRKVAQTLTSCGILSSERGFQGGISLARPAETISVLDIVRAFESATLNRCTADPPLCDRRDTCAAYPVWVEAQSEIERVLGEARLSDLVQRQATPDGRVPRRRAARPDSPPRTGGDA